MKIGVIGAGSFGTALACALASEQAHVVLWARDPVQARTMNDSRRNAKYLPNITLPPSIVVTDDLQDLDGAACNLLVVPAQQTSDFVDKHTDLIARAPVVLCAKGIERSTFRLQSDICPSAHAVLTGPGFAEEIAQGLPTALTLAEKPDGPSLQALLSRPRVRLYRSTDLIGAQLGGALKNVVAIAAGVAIGAGLGESARAAIMTRGFAEMRRLAAAMGAQDQTLSGLSGFGDLALTCASTKSRNFAHGVAVGSVDCPKSVTVEGVATVGAALALAQQHDVEMPVAQAVASVLEGGQEIATVIGQLLSRPLREE